MGLEPYKSPEVDTPHWNFKKKPLNGVVTEWCFLSTQMYGLSDSLIRTALQRRLCLRPTVWTDQESLSERSRSPGYPH